MLDERALNILRRTLREYKKISETQKDMLATVKESLEHAVKLNAELVVRVQAVETESSKLRTELDVVKEQAWRARP